MNDSSKIAALASPKLPSIASRRPMLSSQRSLSVLSINTSATHGDMLRRNSSATTSNRHRRLQDSPLSLPTTTNGNMSPEELTSKIADSFQQFSSMLSQLSSNKQSATSNNTITTPVSPPLPTSGNSFVHPITSFDYKSQQQTNMLPQQKPLSSPPLSSSKKATVTATQTTHRKEVRSSHRLIPSKVIQPQGTTLSETPQSEQNLPNVKQLSDSDNDSEMDDVEKEEYVSHAIYSKNAFSSLSTTINKGNTSLRRLLIAKWLTRAASSGDLETMQSMLDSIEDIDVNCTDNTKTRVTSLMYAAYFGHTKCLNLLLNHPQTQINQQDKNLEFSSSNILEGWTALMWAINSGQVEASQILLSKGAEKLVKTRFGRTVFDYPTLITVKKLLGTPPIPDKPIEKQKVINAEKSNHVDGTVEKVEATQRRNSNGSVTNKIDYYATDGYSHFVNNHSHTASTDPKRKSISSSSKTMALMPPDFSQLTRATVSPQQLQKNKENSMATIKYHSVDRSNIIDDEDDMKKWEESIKSFDIFSWNKCLPDQIFVFSQDDMHFILDQALTVTDIKSLANKSQFSNELWQPANILFLSCRFAHYCSSRELLTSFLTAAAAKLSRMTKTVSRDIQASSFWIANMCQLSSYLKKDPGLSISTKDAQETLSELISEAYSNFILESQKKIEKILEAAMMEYESIHELEQVDFVDDWQRFFRRSSSNNSRKSVDTVYSTDRKLSLDSTSTAATIASNSFETTSSSSSSTSSSLSPHSVTNLLTQVQSILQAYHVPPAIVIQAMAQFFHYLSCELFNRVLTYKKYLCRSKALQLRMNLSVMEEWVRANQLPASLTNTFEPLVQLLQLLQCLSQMDDVITFTSTTQTFDKLNALQVKRCVQNYRYEVAEPRLPEAVEQLANQIVLDNQNQRNNSKRNSLNIIYTRASMDNLLGSANSRSSSIINGRPASITSLNCLLTTAVSKKRLSTEDIESMNHIMMIQQLDDDEEGDMMDEEEKRNSKNLLPFSIPVTTALLQGWSDEKHKKSLNSSLTNYSDAIYKDIKLRKQEQFNLLDKIYPTIPEEWLYHLDKRLHAK